MRRAGVCLLFVSVLLLHGCATDGPRRPEQSYPAQPLVLEGFTFLSPNEVGWLRIQKTLYGAALAKRGQVVDESYAIQAVLLRLPRFDSDAAFLAYSIHAVDNDTNPGRFKILYNDDRLVAGQHGNCVRYVLKARDSDPLTVSGRQDPMLLEVVSFICRHPENPEIGISLSYSKRYYQSEAVEDLMPTATGLFDSLRFTTLTRVGSGALPEVGKQRE